MVASIWYLVLTTILSFVQNALEKRMSRGVIPVARRRSILSKGTHA
jgi:hypothetical protein